MDTRFLEHLRNQTEQIKANGLEKTERILTSPQNTCIQVKGGTEVLNFCANNYLGLSNHPELIAAVKVGADERGFGLSSVRFICGTQDVHKRLEDRISRFLQMEDSILYSSCWDANGGLFETILGPEDAIISDSLNHASIIDGIRLCKSKRLRYKNNDMADLRSKLEEAKSARYRVIATDGVFSMDGFIANLTAICDLADEYQALVMVDDSHAVGFVGEKGKGTPELTGTLGRIDILTGTFGKALGGASGGYTAARKEIVALLRQRSRPYLFSNSLAPMIAHTTLHALDLIEQNDDLRTKLRNNSQRFRAGMEQLGYRLLPGDHPIIPVMLGDARLASTMADKLLEKGVYVIGFSFPVVPKGEARIRTQMSAAHTNEQIDRCIEAFRDVGYELGVIS